MNEIILIKYGEIILKGLNRHIFEDKLVNNIKNVAGDSAKVYKSRATLYAEPFEGSNIELIVSRIRKVFGVVSVTRAAVSGRELDDIAQNACAYLEKTLTDAKTFKVETKRADKSYPIKSPEISREIGGAILSAYPHLKVDVINPQVQVNIEVRENGAYIYADSEKLSGPGGLPTGSSAKALLLLSGGIDSPVAGYMIGKRGAVIEGIHFFSPPFTSDAAKQKVLDLAQILTGYTGAMKVHIVPFTKPQLKMRENCPEEHLTLIMRRMMMKISSIIAKRENAACLVTGESLGQVASQTIEALGVTDDAADRLCLRPLIGMDKEEIVAIAKNIGTFDTSILPYEDCCTVFVPRHPTTRPKLESIKQSESNLDFDALVKEAIDGTETVIIEPKR
ncbi:MAG: tRNA 4-thiouridine(8) synthase ThiI [Clostridia bacterium]|nr:tRNA 4-thiouridine(8) synthase ThiI [Clostridia bacterium]